MTMINSADRRRHLRELGLRLVRWDRAIVFGALLVFWACIALGVGLSALRWL